MEVNNTAQEARASHPKPKILSLNHIRPHYQLMGYRKGREHDDTRNAVS
jgi:hypothetical protein